MKIYQVSFDASLVTVIADDITELQNILIEAEEDVFVLKNNKIFWQIDDYSEECTIEDITNNRGIIQWESH